MEFNIHGAVGVLQDIAGRLEGALQGSFPVAENEDTHAIVTKEPYGVILGIAPWYVSLQRFLLFLFPSLPMSPRFQHGCGTACS